MLNGFAPIMDKNARLLILGTMPSVRSLEKGQYYGHPQNAFWPIVFSLWKEPASEDYEERKAFLLRKRIALWDVLKACEREGSADTDIREPQPNDFVWLRDNCPKLEALCFNSKNAAQYYGKYVHPDPFKALPKKTLPSTSPARAMRFQDKQACWLPVYQFLCK